MESTEKNKFDDYEKLLGHICGTDIKYWFRTNRELVSEQKNNQFKIIISGVQGGIVLFQNTTDIDSYREYIGMINGAVNNRKINIDHVTKNFVNKTIVNNAVNIEWHKIKNGEKELEQGEFLKEGDQYTAYTKSKRNINSVFKSLLESDKWNNGVDVFFINLQKEDIESYSIIEKDLFDKVQKKINDAFMYDNKEFIRDVKQKIEMENGDNKIENNIEKFVIDIRNIE